MRKCIVVLIIGIVGILLSLEAINLHEDFQVKKLLMKVSSGDVTIYENSDYANDVSRIIENESQEVEWIAEDINGDGKKDIVLRYKNYYNQYMNSIIAIFCREKNTLKCVYWDATDGMNFKFFCKGKMIDYYPYSGTFTCIQFYGYEYSKDWSLDYIEGYKLYYLDNLEELSTDWEDEHPDMTKIGTYYRKELIDENGNKYEISLTQGEWNQGIEGMIGQTFEVINPIWSWVMEKP